MKQRKNSGSTGQRRIKVQEKHISRAYQQYSVFPEIRLSGKWLQDSGFTAGQTVTILHEKNRIVIMAGQHHSEIN